MDESANARADLAKQLEDFFCNTRQESTPESLEI